MVSKKKEYALSFVGLVAVVLAFFAILTVNNSLALVAAFFAMVAMIMTIFFIYSEDEKLEGEIKQIRKDERRSRK